MPSIPETRASLIVRLADCADIQAWHWFVEIYEPLIYRLARGKGFQHHDAVELTQEVMMAVAKAVAGWDPDPSKGRFRSWLFRISRNTMINFLTSRKQQPLGSGDSQVMRWLAQQPDPCCAESALFDLEYKRQVFQWAAQRVKAAVQKTTWKAFWRTSVEDAAIEQPAKECGLTPGAVYIARSRVMARLRREVQQWMDPHTDV